MAKQNNQKIKLLALYQLLAKQTDEHVHLTTNEIIEGLRAQGISADRKTIYEDIKCLNASGYEVLIERRKSNEYYIVNRPFDLVELRILKDAVQAAKFITPTKTTLLIDKLAKLTSTREGELLKKSVVSSVSAKHTNEHIFYNTDTIYNCIINNKKVSFLYFDYTVEGQKEYRKSKKRYVVNPIELVLSQENYYLICFMDKYQNIINFRIDRMTEVQEEKEPIASADCIDSFDLNEYKKKVFNMFGGENTQIKILADSSMVNIVLDKFGKELAFNKIDDNSFEVEVEVELSPTFYAWCFQFGGKLKVIHPEDVVLLIKEQLNQLKTCYS